MLSWLDRVEEVLCNKPKNNIEFAFTVGDLMLEKARHWPVGELAEETRRVMFHRGLMKFTSSWFTDLYRFAKAFQDERDRKTLLDSGMTWTQAKALSLDKGRFEIVAKIRSGELRPPYNFNARYASKRKELDKKKSGK